MPQIERKGLVKSRPGTCGSFGSALYAWSRPSTSKATIDRICTAGIAWPKFKHNHSSLQPQDESSLATSQSLARDIVYGCVTTRLADPKTRPKPGKYHFRPMLLAHRRHDRSLAQKGMTLLRRNGRPLDKLASAFGEPDGAHLQDVNLPGTM